MIKLASVVTDKRSGGSEINFTIQEGTRTHRLMLYGDGNLCWNPKLRVDFTDCESTDLKVVSQNIANILSHIAATLAGTEGEKIVQLMKLI